VVYQRENLTMEEVQRRMQEEAADEEEIMMRFEKTSSW
jgi:hypothetical protein